MYVYVITNLINEKIYVGQHAGDNLDAYLRHNISHAMTNNGNKTHLYRAIRKYGGYKFIISPLVRCTNKEEMDAWEKIYIKAFGCQHGGYNITAGGGGRLGTKRPHTEEEKKHMSKVMQGRVLTEEWKKRIGDAQRGRSFTEEHKRALQDSQLGKPKCPRSIEHCLKISENKKKWWAERKKLNDNDRQ